MSISACFLIWKVNSPRNSKGSSPRAKFLFLCASVWLGLFLAAQPLHADARRMRWALEGTDLVEVTFSPLTEADGEQSADPRYLMRSTLRGKGPSQDWPRDLTEIGVQLLLTLPPDKARPGKRWQQELVYADLFRFEEIVLTGKVSLQKQEGFLLMERTYAAGAGKIRHSGQSFVRTVVRSGTLVVKSRIDLATRQVVSGSIRADWNLSYNGETRTESHRFQVTVKKRRLDDQIAFDRLVQMAVSRAVQWLQARQQPDGSFAVSKASREKDNQVAGRSAICLLALLKSGIRATREDMERGVQFLLDQPFQGTYGVALSIMAIEARYATPGSNRVRLPDKEKKWMVEAVQWLISGQHESGLWSYPRPDGSGSYDHSNTQYALLGLEAANRCGIRIPADVWRKPMEHFLAAQESEGPYVTLERRFKDGRKTRVKARARGWGYGRSDHPYASMTAAGVACLVLSSINLANMGKLSRSLNRQGQKSIEDGLAWLAIHYDTAQHPNHHLYFYYYLYGLERAMVFTWIQELAGYDWYDDGALALLFFQKDKGFWRKKYPLVETSFALLFLNRAVTPVAITNRKW